MKLLFTLSLLLCISFSFGQTTFSTAIAGLDHFELYGLVQLSDGSYVATGATYSKTDSSAAIGIVKLSSDGHLLISKTIAPVAANDDVEGAAIIKTSDGGVAVCGTISDTMALLKFDANLNLQWHKQYIVSSADYSYGNKTLQTIDGGYLIAGHLENDTDTSYSAAGYVVKTDAQGNVIWSKQYYNFKDANVLDVAATKDGNYALLASSADYPSNNDSSYLIKITGAGDIIWSKYVSASLDGQEPASLIVTTDGGFAICGSIDRIYQNLSGYNYRDAQVMVLRFDSNGNLGWSRVSDNGLYNDIYIYGIEQETTGAFVITGRFDSYDSVSITSNTRAYTLKINTGGNLVFAKAISFPGAKEFFYDIAPANDGTYAISGSIYAFDDVNGNYDRGCIFKFNSTFSTCGDVRNFGGLSDLAATITDASPLVVNLTTTAGTIATNETAAGTEFAICSTLPLQLLSFNAVLQNKSVNIAWQTANEVNMSSYTVERSSNGSSFTALQSVSAKGNSSNMQTYTATDLQPLFGTSYYRLKQVSTDGSFTYSNTVPVTISANGTIVISPNPVQSSIRILLQSAISSQATFRVTDMTGKTLSTQITNVNTGTNTIIIPAGSLSKGLYVLKVIQNGSVQSIKFMKD